MQHHLELGHDDFLKQSVPELSEASFQPSLALSISYWNFEALLDGGIEQVVIASYPCLCDIIEVFAISGSSGSAQLRRWRDDVTPRESEAKKAIGVQARLRGLLWGSFPVRLSFPTNDVP